MLECNVACARIFGYETAAELVGQPLWQTPAERGRREELIARLRAEKRLTNVETSVSRGSGGTAWLLENLGLAEEKDGEPPAIEGTVVDITERKQAEEALRHSEERFESVFRSSPLAIGISAMAGARIIDVNEQCAIALRVRSAGDDRAIDRRAGPVGRCGRSRPRPRRPARGPSRA